MFRLLILLSALAFAQQSFAVKWGGGLDDSPGDHMILCEVRLKSNKGLNRELKHISENFLGRPYILSYLPHDMTAEGYEKLGLSGLASPRDLQDLVLTADRSPNKDEIIVTLYRLQSGVFRKVHNLAFHWAEPNSDLPIWIEEKDLGASYVDLLSKYQNSDDRVHRLNLVSDPDADGVRKVLSFSVEPRAMADISTMISLGIDVPPEWDQAKLYSEDLAEVTDDLRTPARNWRRIKVLRFARMDGSADIVESKKSGGDESVKF